MNKCNGSVIKETNEELKMEETNALQSRLIFPGLTECLFLQIFQ